MEKPVFSPRRWRLVLLLAAAAGTVYFLVLVRGVLAPFLIALGLAYALNPVVAYFCRWRLGRAWSILLVYALVGIVLSTVIVFVIPVIIVELNAFADVIPQYTEQVQGLIRFVQQNYSRVPLPESIRTVVDDTVRGLEVRLLGVIGGVARGILGLFSGLFSLIISPVLAFYFLRDLDHFRQKLVAAIPRDQRPEILALLGEIDAVLGGFIRGQLTVAGIVALMTTVAMTLLGVPFALLIGLVAGIAEIIPYFGPIIGAIPAVVIALLRSPFLAIQVVIAFLAIQQIQNAIISPRIVGENVGLHPLVVIFALLAGGELFGLVGLLLAVPFAGMIRVITRYAYRKLVTQVRVDRG